MSKVNDIQRSNKIELSPRNLSQKQYLKYLSNDKQVFGVGAAGTGKTFLASMVGLRAVLRGEKDKLVIIRPAVEVGGEQHGFLPGKLEQKLAPWLRPIVQPIKEQLGGDILDKMIKDGRIQFESFSHIRGITWNHSFIILDEAQNTTSQQMKAFLTRVGENTKVVVCGDPDQSDLRGQNGLQMALDTAKACSLPIDVLQFDEQDVVRSEQCRMWIKAFQFQNRNGQSNQMDLPFDRST